MATQWQSLDLFHPFQLQRFSSYPCALCFLPGISSSLLIKLFVLQTVCRVDLGECHFFMFFLKNHWQWECHLMVIKSLCFSSICLNFVLSPRLSKTQLRTYKDSPSISCFGLVSNFFLYVSLLNFLYQVRHLTINPLLSSLLLLKTKIKYSVSL